MRPVSTLLPSINANNYFATTDSLSKNNIKLRPNSIIVFKQITHEPVKNARIYTAEDELFRGFFSEYNIIVQDPLKPKVTLLSHTPNPIDVIYQSARQCYYSGCVTELKVDIIDQEKKLNLLKTVSDSGHLSVFEHAYFTFSINNVSRTESHQHVRKRHASYSQQSQRYCNIHGDFEYIIPPVLLKRHNQVELFTYLKTMNYINTQYNSLFELESIHSEDLRFLLPNATVTRFVTTINLRSFFELCNERMCTCAQWEIRDVTKKMAREINEVTDYIFKDQMVPKCKKLGYCNEPENRSCGLMPLKK